MSREAAPGTLQGGQGVGASQEGSGSHSASFKSRVFISPSMKEVSDLREEIEFCVLFSPKEKLICSRRDH